MSIINVYSPKFDVFHDRAVVIWQEKDGPVQITENLLVQYNAWRSARYPKNEPPSFFWESNGPAIARALSFCGASALVASAFDRKVRYSWFRATASPFGGDSYGICPVYAEVGAGNASVVHVTLPTDEEVVFTFSAAEMAKTEWVRTLDWAKTAGDA